MEADDCFDPDDIDVLVVFAWVEDRGLGVDICLGAFELGHGAEGGLFAPEFELSSGFGDPGAEDGFEGAAVSDF